MSKLSNVVSEMKKRQELRPDEIVTNFMGGDSYIVSPLTTLKMITASSIFAEPSYYRDGLYSKKIVIDGKYRVQYDVRGYDVLDKYDNLSTTEIMEQAIDAALDFDFGATLDWAVELRTNFHMRLNPQIIMVRAALHNKREEWTKENPGKFKEYQLKVMKRADEPTTQLSYFLFKNHGKKNKLPSILKRSIADKLSKLDRYSMAKYKNHEIGMINAVRLTHAKSLIIDELMQTGTIKVTDDEKTWENLRSEGKSWIDIINTINVGHMAMLRNLRGVFEEINDLDFCKKYLSNLKAGVLSGKQFPFRYWSAIRAIEQSRCNHQPLIIDALEECIDISIDNMPKLQGKTMCLSDNSGSAWGTFNSSYGSCTIAEIDNLSSVITAKLSEEGYVGKFGDTLKIFPVSKRNGILTQTKDITYANYSDVGGSTEGGIWEFFKKALVNKEHWDNIFIYSDQQAGTGELYGTSLQYKQYGNNFSTGHQNINVFKLIQEYRKTVNSKVNVFSIQTAGYNDVVIPELAYRTHLLYGWTGREVEYAKTMIDLWDENEFNKKINIFK